MATVCLKTLQLCRLRIARLEPNGVPDPGAGNLYVTDQQISLTLGLEISEGDDFEQKTGCGDICFSYKDRDRVKGLNLQLSLCTADPELTELLIGGDLITDGGDTIGYALPEVGTTGNPYGVSLEAWTKNISGSSLDPDYPYVRWVMGKTFWTPSDKTFENGPIVHNFTGKGEENVNFHDGPANDWPYTSDRLYQYAVDTALPTAQCGAQVLPVS